MILDNGIDYISHPNALRYVLIRELIKFYIVMPCAMGLYNELIIFLFVLPCEEKKNQFHYLISSQGIRMRNIINSLIKTLCKALQWEILTIPWSKLIARHYDIKYNLFPYQNPSQGITMRKIINILIKTHRKA